MLQKYTELGSKWHTIASFLGRSNNACKNRLQLLQRRNSKALPAQPPPPAQPQPAQQSNSAFPPQAASSSDSWNIWDDFSSDDSPHQSDS
ncbi:MAG: SANT/Myb domain-containing protein [Puniceicoccales bacterium]|nr:SANT/Myb domain-containing protein [Puniceicoccales bacterium]